VHNRVGDLRAISSQEHLSHRVTYGTRTMRFVRYQYHRSLLQWYLCLCSR